MLPIFWMEVATFFYEAAYVYAYYYLSHSYSMYVCVSVCAHSHISWPIFTKTGTELLTPKSKNEFIWGQYHTTPSSLLPKAPI